MSVHKLNTKKWYPDKRTTLCVRFYEGFYQTASISWPPALTLFACPCPFTSGKSFPCLRCLTSLLHCPLVKAPLQVFLGSLWISAMPQDGRVECWSQQQSSGRLGVHSRECSFVGWLGIYLLQLFTHYLRQQWQQEWWASPCLSVLNVEVLHTSMCLVQGVHFSNTRLIETY